MMRALEAYARGLELTDPKMMALTDQIDLAYAMVRTPLADSAELAAIQETIRVRTNSVPGYLAAQQEVVPLVNAYCAFEGRQLIQTQDLMRFKLNVLRACTA